jgi:sulfate permease, SulP family
MRRTCRHSRSVWPLALLWCGERWLPNQPVALGVVALSIAAVGSFQLTRLGIAVTGPIPPGLPLPTLPTIRLRDQDGIAALAMGCMLLAYVEGVAAARAFAAKHGDSISPRRELLGLAAANIATVVGGGYPVAGGLSQTAVNEKAGARSRLSLVFASLTLAVCLLFLTALLADLPRAVLAAVVLLAVGGLIDVPALAHMWRASRIDFFTALAALIGVLLLGILQGILLAALVRFCWFWPSTRRRTWRFSAAFQALASILTRSGMPIMSPWLACLPSGPRLRCSISMPNSCWRMCSNGL